MVLEQTPAPQAPSSPDPGTKTAALRLSRGPELARGLIIGMLLLLTFLLASFAVRNSEFWLRLASGRLIAQGQYQFGVDPFSFTTENVYWANSSWLYDLLIYLIYQMTGGAGLVLAKALLMAGLAWLLLQFRRPEQTVILPVVASALAIVVMSPRFLLQPMCLSLFFLGMTLFLLERSKQVERRLWLLPPLFLLWANLDSWFILGLLLVFLYFVGALIEGVDKPRRRRLSLSLLLCVACCLINPHLFRVFTLPAELAYLVAQLSDRLGVDPPEWMVAAGRTWQVLRDNDGNFLLTLSPLSEEYRSLSGLGNNLAGKAYFLFLLLGLGSFIPAFVVSPGGLRKRPWSLLVVWLPVAVLSLVLARMIGFFAVVTGPVVVLNLQDFLAARAARAGKPLPKPTPLIGVATGLLLAGLLILAWPGWVNGPLDSFSAARRVAWSVEPDASFRQVAERLDRLHKEGKARGGVALSFELANYLPWFAPGVKSYCDSRYELFPGVVDNFFRIRRLLSRDANEFFAGKAPPLEFQFAEWRKLAERHDLDFVAVTNFQRAPVTQQLASRFWLEPSLWPFLYGDGRSLIFGWSRSGQPDRFAGKRIDWNAAAFGIVPDDQRPPAQGSIVPEPESFLEKYAQGLQPPPLAISETYLFHAAYQFFGQNWKRYYFPAWQVSALAATAGMGGAVPGMITAQPNMMPFIPIFMTKLFAPMLRAVDAGPPALPVLMVRAGRRAVAEAPRCSECYLNLADACKTLWLSQENHWALDRGQNRLELSYARSIAPRVVNSLDFRNMLRRVQVIAALKSCLRLDPDNWRVHELLGEIYILGEIYADDLYYLDVALDHYVEALARFERLRPADPKLEEMFREKRAQLQNTVKHLDNRLKRHKNDYDLRSSGKNALEKYALALRRPYKAVDLNKDRPDPRGMGLALSALFALQSAKLGQPEDFFVVANQLDLLLLLGEVQFVGEVLAREDIRKLLGPAVSYYQTIWAAAVGDYQLARAALTAQIEQNALVKQVNHIRAFLILKLAPAHNIAELCGQAHWFLADRDGLLGLAKAFQPTANLHLLRGLMALEQGDTPAALRDFQTCHDLSASVFLPDRPIAEHYLALLSGQLRK